MQEAHLYLMKTYAQMGMIESIPTIEKSCVALAPDSCIAAQCRSAQTTLPTEPTQP
jgi:hypothetical protein